MSLHPATNILQGKDDRKDKATLMNDLLYIVQCMKLGIETITSHSMTSGMAWVIQEPRRNLIVVLRYQNEIGKNLKDHTGSDKEAELNNIVQEHRTNNLHMPKEYTNEEDSLKFFSVANLQIVQDSATEESVVDANVTSGLSMHRAESSDASHLLNQPNTEQYTHTSSNALVPSSPVIMEEVESAETCSYVKDEISFSSVQSEHLYCDTSYLEEVNHQHNIPLDALEQSSQPLLVDSENHDMYSLSLQHESTQELICNISDVVDYDNQSNEQCTVEPSLESTLNVQEVIVNTVEIPKILSSLLSHPQSIKRKNSSEGEITEQYDISIQPNDTPLCTLKLSFSSISKECNEHACDDVFAVGTNAKSVSEHKNMPEKNLLAANSSNCGELSPIISKIQELGSSSPLMSDNIWVVGDKVIMVNNKTDALAIMSQNPKAKIVKCVVKAPSAATSMLNLTNLGKEIVNIKPNLCVDKSALGTKTTLVVQNGCLSVTENLACGSSDLPMNSYRPTDGTECQQSGNVDAQNSNQCIGLPSGKMPSSAGFQREHHQVCQVENALHKDSQCEKQNLQPLKSHQMVHTGKKPCFACDCKKTFTLYANLKRHRRYRCKLNAQKILQCAQCGKTFGTVNELKMHERAHMGEKPYQCTYCEKRFSSKTNMKSHARSHTGEKLFPCSDCGKTFTHSTNLKIHKIRHSGEKPFPCSLCTKQFSTSAELKVHQRSHTGEKPYQCNQCEKKYSQIQNLKRHYRTHTGEKPFECLECNKNFTYAEDLKKHRLRHTGEKPYQCSHCGKKFSRPEVLKNHERVHTGVKPYQCSYCARKFTSSGLLKAHKKCHTQREKSYLCTQCGKAFFTSNGLKQHERRHVEVKPYQCSQCEMKFFNEKNLKMHEVVHTGKRPFKCVYCEKMFFRADSLKVHHRVHTGEKRYKCSYCEMTFMLKHQLQKHELVHTGEKPYKCYQCKKTFYTSGNLKKHEKIHLTVKPFQCLCCDKSFTLAYQLTTHEKIHVDKGDLHCIKCDKDFKTLKSLKKHQARKHKNGGK